MTPSTLSPLLICAVYIAGITFSQQTGQEFITAFLQNSDSSLTNDGHFQLVITAYAQTSAKVSLNKRGAKWSFKLKNGESRTVNLPADIEMIGSGYFDSSILVNSTHDISVTAISSKTNSASRILVLPVDQLDSDYYIVTPSEETNQNLKEFAVVNYDLPSKVHIHVQDWVTYNGINYTSNYPLTVDLSPFQIFQLQSPTDLSGTRVFSKNLIAVLSGNTCSWKNNRCGHIYEQLLPVSSWGKEFYVSPIPFQYGADTAYVTASQNTQVNYMSRINNGTAVIRRGQFLIFRVRHNSPLKISANAPVQVMFYCTGGTTQQFLFDPFFVELPDTSKYCTKYQVHGLEGFTNAVLITAKTAFTAGIKFNKMSLQNIQWKNIYGTKYSYALYRYGQQSRYQIVSHPRSMLSVLSVGVSHQNSYGLSGVCLTRNSSCANKNCRQQESCQMIHGKAACIPDSEAICQVWGDAHYQTFDGLSFDFQGTCSYTVAKTCARIGVGPDPSLPEFSVEANYENRGSHQSSYIGMVTVLINDYNITMVQSEFGYVRVNNVRWALPILLDNGMTSITMTGFHALLETSFIRIRYDWNMFLFIKIPSSFSDNVCGLCGNYNGNKDDDWEGIDGTQVTDLVQFAQSWKVPDEYPTCCDDCCGVCNPVPPDVGEQYNDTGSCGIISQDYGPFHMCYLSTDPTIFLQNCVNDMLKIGGYKKVLCEDVSVYLLACQIQGVQVEGWRSSVGCDIECPENSRYNPCGDPCPETCGGTSPSCDQQLPCIESCECNPGFVLHEDKCINQTNCGSFCDGRYYPPGETFWADESCTQKCSFDPDSETVQCVDYTCRAGEACEVRNGIIDCYPVDYKQCSLFGESHYTTFDSLQYDFHGTCRYQLSGLCDQSRGLIDFSIEVSILSRGNRDISYTRSVLVTVYGIEILLTREEPSKAMVNDMLVNLPYNWNLDQVQLFVQGWDVVILTNFSLKVTFDRDSRITVTLPQSYTGAVCGLCGNYNGIKTDEMTTKNGAIARKITAFGNSWRTADKPAGCREEEPVACPTLKTLEQNQRRSLADCGIILKRDGPFQDCHSFVNPEPYFQDCLHDFCVFFAREDVFCKVIEAYAAACQVANGTLHGWRRNNFCKAWCPDNSYYALCSLGCAKTCSHLRCPYDTDNSCREGCVCKDGFLLDGDQCVPLSQCGCLYKGIYYKTNEIFYPTSDCEKKCLCQPGGWVKCYPHVCMADEVCQLQDGVRKCQGTEPAICSVTGSSLYQTFDGFTYHFQGDCTYLLTKLCSPDNSVPPIYSVYLTVGAPKKVTVFVNGVKIVMTQGRTGTGQVNDDPFNLPINLRDQGVWVSQSGSSIVLSTDCGLEVTYDLGSQVIIELSNDYQGMVCGLCGNYNGNTTDEYQFPDGSQATNVIAFGESWKNNSLGLVCRSQCQSGFCPTCAQKNLYTGKNSCGLLLANDGLFSACHSRVDPQEYFNNCLRELCLARGNAKVLCNSLQNYATICKHVGVAGIKWRSNTFCRFDCPPNSHYKVCTDTCTNTCARITTPIPCSSVCPEGCQCDEGYYNDKDKCVTLDKCGCFIKGRYYMLNEAFLDDGCQHSCTCHLGNVVTCKPYSCPPKTTCQMRFDMTYMCEQA